MKTKTITERIEDEYRQECEAWEEQGVECRHRLQISVTAPRERKVNF